MGLELLVEPVHRVTLVDSTVQRIRDVIEGSELKPGDRLPGELELAKGMNVSRTVVREAISRLQTIGLLTVTRGRGGGTFVGNQDAVLGYANVVRSVMSISDKDAKQFSEFRAALEIYSARQAALVATDEDVAELDKLCSLIGNSKAGDDAATTSDFDFHRKIAQMSGNEVILRTLRLSREFIQSTMRETGPRDSQKSQSQHQAVVDAIRNRNADDAEKAMRLHMESVIEGLQSMGPK